MWAVLIFIIAFTGLSVYSAFIGPLSSVILFSSLPLIIFWFALIVLLILSIAVFRKEMKGAGILLILIGCIVLLAGLTANSPKGQQLIHRHLGMDKILAGEMMIYKEIPENMVWSVNDSLLFTLPFSLKLKKLRIEYYKSGNLFVSTPDKQQWNLPVTAGEKYELDPNVGSVRILKIYKNFKIITEDGNQRAYDSNEPGSNPVVLIEYKAPKGSIVDKFIYAKYPNPVFEDDKIFVNYIPNLKQVYSDIDIIKDGDTIKTATMQINRPLHFGGYHFYQYGFDDITEQYSRLGVVSDTGIYVVYAGYMLLCVGILWQFWFRHIFFRRNLIKKQKIRR